jgi:hypothetical protein
MEDIEQSEKKEISQDLCENMENKYNQLLLSSEEETILFNKIMVYYQLKEQLIKQSFKKCQLCGNKAEHTHPNISDIFTSTYNKKTQCRELQIKCISKNKCTSMIIKYGIVFNLDNQTNENKKILEFIKNQIIINKNNILYGLVDEEEGVNIHKSLLDKLQEITDIYKTQLYYVLFYANNKHMNKDIQQLRNDIKYKILEIKELIIKENYEKVVENYIDIMNLHKCLINMNKYKSTIYSEQLFKCDTDIPIENNQIPDFNSIVEMTKPNKNRNKNIKENKKKTLKTDQVMEKTTTKNIKKIDKITHILNHMLIIFEGDFIDELLDTDKDFIEQVYMEMNDLNKIMKYATKEQQELYEIINDLYQKKIKELNWTPNNMRGEDEDVPPPSLHIEEISTPTNPDIDINLRDKFDSDAILL